MGARRSRTASISPKGFLMGWRIIEKRLEILERNATPEQGHPVHRVIFEGDPEPTDLPPGSSVHRIVFVDPPAPASEPAKQPADIRY